MRLRGRHNLANILAAACLASAAGAPLAAIRASRRPSPASSTGCEIVRRARRRDLGQRLDRDCARAHGRRYPLVRRAARAAARRPRQAPALGRMRADDRSRPASRCVVLFGEAAGLIEPPLSQAAAQLGKPGNLSCAALTCRLPCEPPRASRSPATSSCWRPAAPASMLTSTSQHAEITSGAGGGTAMSAQASPFATQERPSIWAAIQESAARAWTTS